MTKQLIAPIINGLKREIAVEPQWTLLQTVRDELGLTGSKEGCGTGDCGACSVIVNGQLVTSCLILAAEADGAEVTTVEGLAHDGQLDAVQKAFVDAGGTQCGFCTPGMVMAARALLDRNPNPTLEDVRLGLAGNLCRCTGYTKIYDAVLSAAQARG
ncbi:MAG TPA: (2Fe-2S)-binding protein [Dehalococcoidia bacterium]|nr:(2Fe-2S)-binding protein [Dehalococcoidia bacterium]